MDDLLAEIDEELPDTRSPIPAEATEQEEADDAAMTAVQKKVQMIKLVVKLLL